MKHWVGSKTPVAGRWRDMPWGQLLGRLRLRFVEVRLGQAAGSLTFTTTIALVPLLTVSLAIFTIFPQFADIQTLVQRWLIDSLMPEGISRQVLSYVTQFTTKASRLGLAGMLVLVLSALTLVFTLDRAFNAIWGVTKPRPWAHRILVYWAAMTLGPIMMGLGVATMSHVVSVSRGLAQAWPQSLHLAIDALEWSLLVLGVGALFKYLPNVHVRWTHALAGGLWVTVAIEVARRVLTWYLSEMPAFSKVYGALATFPILLVWIYTAWMIVLSGAVMVSLLPGVLLRRVRVADGPGWTLTQSIETLQLLQQTRLENRTGLSPSELALRLRFDPAELEVAVRLLMDLGWVARLDGEDRLVLLIETEQTPAAPLLVQTLLAPSEATQALWQAWQGITLADLLAHAHQARPS
jgi:membrane protein